MALFDFLSSLLQGRFPDQAKKMRRVWLPFLFSAWAAANLNVNTAVASHRDKFDMPDGICCVLVFGDFEGGELCFPEMVIFVKHCTMLSPPTNIFFKSELI